MKRIALAALSSLLLVALFACSSNKATTAETPAPKPMAQPQAQPTAQTAAQPAAPAVNADGSSADTTAKLAAAEWALKQDEIKNDPNGQWAITASASSTYGDAKGNSAWSANHMTGAPDVQKYQDDGNAWAPKEQDMGIEWVDVTYAKPVHATEVRIRESMGSGAVIKVELYDEDGKAHAVWQGNDPTTGLNYLMVKFPKTTFKTSRVKVTLATNVVPGWNEIDAVQLVGTEQ